MDPCDGYRRCPDGARRKSAAWTGREASQRLQWGLQEVSPNSVTASLATSACALRRVAHPAHSECVRERERVRAHVR
eukprot:13725977-Alexandrium_andersonii.AAC.1